MGKSRWGWGLFLCASAAWGAQDSPAIESTRATLSKWMETQEIIAKERKDWQVGKDLLEHRIALLESENAELDERLAETHAGAGNTEEKHRQLVEKRDELEAAAATLEQAIGRLETRTRRLVERLPEPIRDRVRPLSQRLPDDPSSTRLSLGERYQNVVGILNEVNKFNQDVTVTSEVRELPGGSTAEVEVLYIGLGQAYYVTPDRHAAGVGRAASDGWEWKAADDLAGPIAEAIAILRNEQKPAYVPLSVTVQ